MYMYVYNIYIYIHIYICIYINLYIIYFWVLRHICHIQEYKNCRKSCLPLFQVPEDWLY